MHKAGVNGAGASGESTVQTTNGETPAGTDPKKNNFRYFYKFMANNEVYLVPRDHEKHDSVCISDQLLKSIMNANQKEVFDYDFTEVEQKSQKEHTERNEELREILEFKGVAHFDEEMDLRRKYSYYEPNREFSGKKEDQKLKRIDDGTFVDNGYR